MNEIPVNLRELRVLSKHSHCQLELETWEDGSVSVICCDCETILCTFQFHPD